MPLKMPITPVRNLGEQAYESIRESIISLELLPGQIVQENELAISLGISRTPVRDAFHLLISEQLIEVLPQRTKKIASISVSKVLESNIVRLSLESTAFQLAAKQWGMSEDYIKVDLQLEKLLDEQKEAAQLQNTALFLRLDEWFHKQIMLLAGNQTLFEVVHQMRGHLNRFRFLAMKELVLTKGLVREHEEIFACLRSRDERGVVQLLETHLGRVKEEIPSLREKFASYFQD
ncbi:GntR family transcriptional regulator [Paenibacillus nasutitermitis]|uniref:GntR family transcriptional regulator n=1 Tax=Paenibacillus nasutitermitis TaxID=1652958 RepID=A0A916YTL7_9BACL|nr:GntR family transcriptional regulator [Paenibacillus nasutitermitis]GGD60705.1 GntR family transcriptional regulator [Paenibacillus nasutitermitis]